MKKYLVPIAIIACAGAVSLLTGTSCEKAAGEQPGERTEWPVMGTIAGLTARGCTAESCAAARAATQEIYERTDMLMSAWKPDSELCRLSARFCEEGTGSPEKRNAALVAAADPWARPCYAAAFRISDETGGAFNPVIGQAMQNAGFTRRSAIDLGAIAKGFAVDRAWETLNDAPQYGTAEFLIDLGGNLRACRSKKPWRIGIRNPFAKGSFAAAVALADGEAVATSGNYERFVTTTNGLRVSHIMDGRTGRPCSGIAGVTVLHPSSAMLADAISTSLFVLGPRDGAAFLAAHHPEALALWIPDTPEAPQILATKTMAARLENTSFALSIIE